MSSVIRFTNKIELERKILNKGSIGFVPTMGNLHLGHLSLVERSLIENDVTVVSIFVNPKQFSPNEDFYEYPRTLDEDVEKLKRVAQEKKKEIILFNPLKFEDVFLNDELEKNVSALYDSPLLNILEGEIRPGFFHGVVSVVAQLFDIVKPTRSYFGEKDFQQTRVIDKLNKFLKLDNTIVTCPIIREESGLAMSSRNQYLNKSQKEESSSLRAELSQLKNQLENKNNLNIQEVIDDHLKKSHFPNWNYLTLREIQELAPVTKKRAGNFILLANVEVNNVRLLDNIKVEIKQ